MTRAKPVRSRRKGGVSENFQHIKHALADLQRAASGIGKFAGQLSVRAPVYAASAGLVAVYGWGFVTTYPGPAAIGAIGIFVMAEFLKPRLLELIEDRLREGAWLKGAGLVLAAVACIAIGVGGMYVATSAIAGPARDYVDARSAVDAARREIARIDGLIADVPPVPTNIPAERIVALGGADRLRQDRLDEIARLEATKPTVPALPARPLVVIPEFEWTTKLVIGAVVEFVIFVVPWGSTRRLAPVAPVVVKAEPAKGARRPNDGGWATRIARYGPSGRKPKRRFGVVKGGKA